MQTIVELPVTTRAIDVYSPPDNQEQLLIRQHTEEEGVSSNRQTTAGEAPGNPDAFERDR